MYARGDVVRVTFWGVESQGVVTRDQRSPIVFVLMGGRERWFYAQNLSKDSREG